MLLLYAHVDGAWAGGVRCLLTSNTLFFEEVIINDYLRGMRIAPHLMLAAARVSPGPRLHRAWARLVVRSDRIPARRL